VTNISTASKPSSLSWLAMVVAISCARFSSDDRYGGGKRAPNQDLVLMMVGRSRVGDDLTARIARHHHRDLGLQIQCLLGDARLPPQGRQATAPLSKPSCRTSIFTWPFAVVTAAGPLEVNPAA
jgi:hypothetical protein